MIVAEKNYTGLSAKGAEVTRKVWGAFAPWCPRAKFFNIWCERLHRPPPPPLQKLELFCCCRGIKLYFLQILTLWFNIIYSLHSYAENTVYIARRTCERKSVCSDLYLVLPAWYIWVHFDLIDSNLSTIHDDRHVKNMFCCIPKCLLACYIYTPNISWWGKC